MDYSSLTVVKLKEELKNRGIPLTGLGRKQQIIDRLVEEDAKQTEEAAVASDDQEAAAPALEAEDAEAAEAEEIPAPQEAATAAVEEQPVQHPPEPSAQPSAEPTAQLPAELPVGPSREVPLRESNEMDTAKDVGQDAQEPSSNVNEADAAATVSTNGHQTPVEPTISPDSVASASAERKRKRRSASPLVHQVEINKRLKQDVEDNRVDVEMRDQEATREPIQEPAGEIEIAAENSSESHSNNKEAIHVAQVAHDMDATRDDTQEPNESVTPAIHPATNSLYIRNLKRPLQVNALKRHLSELAQEEDGLTLFHLDAIRTHALVRFVSTKAASRVRSRLHNQVWPSERDREPLWVDFVPEEKMEDWVELETRSGEGGRGASMRRWEVAYAKEQDGNITATLQEASEVTSRQPFYSDQRPLKEARAPLPPSQSIPEEKQPAPVAFANLEQRFNSTTAKPKLYWLPVAKKLADARLDELDALTTRRGTYPESGSGWSDSRRYTFEEDDRLVDGGPEFGLRQGRSRAGPSARRGRNGPRARA